MYEKYFGLDQKPFNMTPDPEFLFFTEKHREAFAHLMYGIRERRGFICITGEVGAGKTTLCRALLDEFDDETRIALILNPMLSDVELLETIDEEFFIEHSGNTKKELLDALNDYLIEQHSAGRNVVLVIDESQNLSTATLEQIRIISNLETVKDKLIQIVLIGQPELRDKLARPELRQLNQRITVRYHLTPMNEEETSAYIQHRLSVAGSAGRIRFTPEAVREIYRFSGGVPRSVNVIADRALLIAYVNESFQVTRETILKARDEVAGLPASEAKSRHGGRSLPWRSVATSIALSAIILVAAAASYLIVLNWKDLSSRSNRGLISQRDQTVESRHDEPGTPGNEVSTAIQPTETPSIEPEEDIPRVVIDPEPESVLIPSATETSEIISVEASQMMPVPAEEIESASSNVDSSTPVFVAAIAIPEIAPTPEPTEPANVPAFLPPPLPPAPRYFSAAVARLAKAWLSDGLKEEDFIERLEKGNSDLDRVLADLGLNRIEMILDFQGLRRLGLPVVLEVEDPGASSPRFVLAERVTEQGIEIEDPLTGNETLSKEDLSRIWFGRVHVCIPSGCVGGRIVGPGSYGSQVYRLETDLHNLGYIAAQPDDVWDEETGAALRAFQREHNLKADGVARVETQLNLFVAANRDRLPSRREPPGEKKI